MNVKKRILALLSLLCAVSILLSACGANEESPSVTGETLVVNDFTELSMTYLTYIATNLPSRDLVANGEKAGAGNTHFRTRQWIEEQLEAAGYDDEQIQEKKFTFSEGKKKYTGCNVVVHVDGQSSDRRVIVGAHYDGDGVGDNGSGFALLLATAVSLVDQQPLYDVEYVFFDAEENGLIGSESYVSTMSKKHKKQTEYYINIDSIAFGDYCNVYGGIQNDKKKVVEETDAYELAMEKAAKLGFETYTTEDLDGYYKQNKKGPPIQDNALYSNPWTYDNPAPKNHSYMSPSTGDWGDHAPFKDAGIPYIYLEATNWYAKGDGKEDAYTGYFETDDTSVGENGMFMNTEYDTLENLVGLFPGRAEAHFHIYSPLLSSLILNPDTDTPTV